MEPKVPPALESPKATDPVGPALKPLESEIIAVNVKGDFRDAEDGLGVRLIMLEHSGVGELPCTAFVLANSDPQLSFMMPSFCRMFSLSIMPEFKIMFVLVMFPEFVMFIPDPMSRVVPLPMSNVAPWLRMVSDNIVTVPALSSAV